MTWHVLRVTLGSERAVALRVLIGLVAGFLIGLALAGSSSSVAAITVAIFTPIGAIFVNLIRMTAIPLVVSMLIASIGAMATSAGFGRTGVRALLIAVALLATAAIASVLIAVPVLGHIQIDRSAAFALQDATATASPGSSVATGVPTLAKWLVDLVPQNIVQAVAEGAMLPVIIFAVIFGLALARVNDTKRGAVIGVIDGVAETMQRMVAWVLTLAPIGVFALAVPLSSRLGLAAAGAVITYVVLVVALTVAAIALLLYPLGIFGGPMSMSAFVAYCAPAQAIGFASRSSLATLPAMVTSAEQAGLPRSASRVVLPLAVAMFHFGTVVAQTVGAIFLAQLFSVTMSAPQLASIIVATVLASFAVPGIPGGSVIGIVPVLAAANLPIEGVGILLAVDTIPDMFRTAANVTGAMTLTAVLPSPQAEVV